MDCSPPGSSVRGISQAQILEWVAMPTSRGSPQPRDLIQVSYIASGFFNMWGFFQDFFNNVDHFKVFIALKYCFCFIFLVILAEKPVGS